MKIKNTFIAGLISMAAFSGFCQPATTFVASLSEVDRLTVVRTSIPLTEWHERSFWHQYKNYLERIQNISSVTYKTLQELVQTGKTANEAFENGRKMITHRLDELSLKRQFFDEICLEHNGIIALQFLQTEAMLDMMESSRIYEQTPLRSFRFHPNEFSSTQLKQVKYNIITKALSLTPEEVAIFFPVYSRYEDESEEILGEEYNLYELFTGEPSDITPLLAKRQGTDLLTIMDREIRLKEKYFNEMNTTAGSLLAGRFLAWEDYYSTTAKLYMWVDAP